jgi:hypothetical protein
MGTVAQHDNLVGACSPTQAKGGLEWATIPHLKIEMWGTQNLSKNTKGATGWLRL